ncbi:hypothetical protein OSB04_012174 [Centaurea solstitialis]|uniref:Retrotransposon gag domain-containing protein n=1 Tax=Centaurea solstitialis TaxID=347529 RepID=A0AA38TMM3_9ASTR|nr:hypothetical protein OSB04_012174 [Centaurea solstitialis]
MCLGDRRILKSKKRCRLRKNNLYQGAKIKWVVDEDENSKIFHGIINYRKNKLRVGGILSCGGTRRGDDVFEWVYRIERFFDIQRVMTSGERLRAAVLCLEGPALAWFRWTDSRTPFQSWEELKSRMMDRFQPLQEGSLYEQFLNISQEGSGQDYVALFEKMAAQLEGIQEEILEGTFIKGLKSDLRTAVRIQQPKGLTQVIKLTLGDVPRSSVVPTRGRNSKVGSGAAGKQPFKRMSEAEFADKKAKGLCFRYDGKFAPGHKWPEKSLQVLVVFDGETEGEEEDPKTETNELVQLEMVEVLIARAKPGFDWVKGDSIVAWDFVGDMRVNWSTLIMSFKGTEGMVTLKGIPGLTRAEASLQAMACDVDGVSEGILVGLAALDEEPHQDHQIHSERFAAIFGDKDKIERLVREMVDVGIIRPGTSPFSSPVFLVKKKDGSWRFCVDYRALNKATVLDKFPIPFRMVKRSYLGIQEVTTGDDASSGARLTRFFKGVYGRDRCLRTQGKENGVADALSWRREGVAITELTTSISTVHPGLEDDLRQDPFITDLRTRFEAREEGLHGYSVKGGIVFYNYRVVLPWILQPFNLPERIWEDITMDFVEGLSRSEGFSVILAVVDKLSKLADFVPLKHAFTAATMVGAFIQEIVRLHGIPRSIVSDRNKTDGQTEVVNRSLEVYMRCCVSRRPKVWVKWLPWAEYWYNTSYLSSIKMTPFRFHMGEIHPLTSYDHGSAVTFELTEMGKHNENYLPVLWTLRSAGTNWGGAYWLKLPDVAEYIQFFMSHNLNGRLAMGLPFLLYLLNMERTEATWEGFEAMMQHFSSFHLEDKPRKNKSEVLFFIVNFEKAFDMMERGYLEEIMEGMSFSMKWSR